MDKIVKQSWLWVKFRVKTQESLLDGAPVSMKRCISFIQIQIYQCRIFKEKKESVEFLHKLNYSFSPQKYHHVKSSENSQK